MDTVTHSLLMRGREIALSSRRETFNPLLQQATRPSPDLGADFPAFNCSPVTPSCNGTRGNGSEPPLFSPGSFPNIEFEVFIFDVNYVVTGCCSFLVNLFVAYVLYLTDLRKQKSYAPLGGLAVAEALRGVGHVFTGGFRVFVSTHPSRVVERIECLGYTGIPIFFSSYWATLITLLLAVERSCAVFMPIRYRSMPSRVVHVTVAGLGLVALAVSFLSFVGVSRGPVPACSLNFVTHPLFGVIMGWSLVAIGVVAILCYGAVMLKILSRRRVSEASTALTQFKQRQTRLTVKVSVIMVIYFVTGILPRISFLTVSMIVIPGLAFIRANLYVGAIAGWFSVITVSTFCLMNSDFRTKTCGGCWPSAKVNADYDPDAHTPSAPAKPGTNLTPLMSQRDSHASSLQIHHLSQPITHGKRPISHTETDL
jgi:7 transmembrane receptor (rhodopsin family)